MMQGVTHDVSLVQVCTLVHLCVSDTHAALSTLAHDAMGHTCVYSCPHFHDTHGFKLYDEE
jgi:hypothetical protein